MSAMETIRRLGAASREDFPANRDRTEAINICQTLLTKLQDPFERVWEAVVDVPALVAGIKLCLDIDLFFKWKESGNGDQSCHDLARMVALDRVDILGNVTSISPSKSKHFTLSSTDRSGRILKHLAAHSIIEEVGVETYRPTGFSDAMLTSAKAGIEYL